MARRMIDAGYPVTLWARRAETLAPFADSSAALASSIGELGATADHVGICVVDDAGARDVCESLFPAMRPGCRIAIHSTVHPKTCVELARQAAGRRLSLIDAPVSGGAPAAAAGALTVMVGGDVEAVALARPVFETFGKHILHLGGVGAGQNAKLINNALMTAHMGLAHHALAASAALGLDRAVFIELVKASSGRSFGFETYARLPNPAAFAHGAALLAKDVRLLGEVLGDDPSFVPLRGAGVPFLELAQANKTS
jgi:3-hydroxyisobutyrate dehydrogenase-like beta-hydroxyacid dehydrogenase